MTSHDLHPDHTWKASPGHQILVLDRGAVSLEYPEGWVVDPTEDCIRILDKAPPDDDCTLGVSHQLLPPIDWSSGPSVSQLVETAEAGDEERKVLGKGDIVAGTRPGIDWAWREVRFEDSTEHRPAVSLLGIAVGSGILCILTFAFWETDRARCEPLWQHVLDSLVLGLEVDDPTRGPRLS